MSRKELDRASLLSQVLTKKVTQVQAAKLVGLSDRQLRNLLKDYKRYGPEALVSKKRGKPSNRRLEPPFKENVMQLVRSRYEDFGPTLAAEKLWENHQVKISKETLRQWMISGHLWIGKTQQKKLHPLRQRRMCFGEMLQGDGSHHDWFETGEFCCLMFFIDDATSRITAARFETEETLNGYFAILHEHVLCFGVPRTIYTDRFSVFESSMKKENLTQFRKALTGLEIEWIGANSPQAKGRIERCNRTLQDRLVKEMRLRGIKLDFASMYWALHVQSAKENKLPFPETINLSKNEIAKLYGIPPEASPHKAMNGVNHLIACYKAVVGMGSNHD